MSLVARTEAYLCNPTFTAALGALGTTILVAELFTEISLREAVIISLCAEIAARVATYATHNFTERGAITRTAYRMGRVVGGVILGSLALQTLGYAPLAFKAASLILPLAGGAYIEIAEYLSQ